MGKPISGPILGETVMLFNELLSNNSDFRTILDGYTIFNRDTVSKKSTEIIIC